MRGRSVVGIVAAALVLGAGLPGCGGGSDGGAPVDLTKRLAPGVDFYIVADLTQLREDFDLPEDASPLDSGASYEPAFFELAGPPFSALADQLPDPDILDALDLGAVQAAAGSSAGAGDKVTVLTTSADTGDVGSRLGDLGYEDAGGILTRDGEESFRLDAGVIFAAANPAALRDLPDEPLDELPSPLLGEVNGEVIVTQPGLDDCTRATALTAIGDGSGEIALLVDGGADADRLELKEGSAVSFGDPAVDGDLITVPVSSDEPGFAANRAFTQFLVNYDCG